MHFAPVNSAMSTPVSFSPRQQPFASSDRQYTDLFSSFSDRRDIFFLPEKNSKSTLLIFIVIVLSFSSWLIVGADTLCVFGCPILWFFVFFRLTIFVFFISKNFTGISEVMPISFSGFLTALFAPSAVYFW